MELSKEEKVTILLALDDRIGTFEKYGICEAETKAAKDLRARILDAL